MKVIDLENTFSYGFDPATEQEKADAVLADFREVYDAILAGTAYARYTDGDRKGSIVKITFDEAFQTHKRPDFGKRYSGWRSAPNAKEIINDRFYCIATWQGRRNKVKVSIPNRYEKIEILLDYDGPTVWEKFDAKAAKADLLKNPDQRDINGKLLSIGDRVLYINARYGSRMTLEEGVVQEFVASVNSKTHSFATVIQSKTGEESSLQYPESMVYRLD